MNHNLSTPVGELHVSSVDAKPIQVNGWDGDGIVNEDAWSFFEWTTVTLDSGEDVEVVVKDYNTIVAAMDGAGRTVEVNHQAGGYIGDIVSYLDNIEDDDENAFTREVLESLENGDVEASVEGPMMNYWYPVERIDESNAAEAAFALRDLPLVVVMVDDAWGIALSGGGMDLSWEIATGYVVLGELPPVHFELPAMADGDSPRKRYVFRAMLRSLNVMHGWMLTRANKLTGAHPDWETE